jgi:hypothetical protein
MYFNLRKLEATDANPMPGAARACLGANPSLNGPARFRLSLILWTQSLPGQSRFFQLPTPPNP